MADIQTVSALVTGGQANAGPPLGPTLGPLGVNILQIVNAINEKTKDFEGMKVPVTVSVDKKTKQWTVEVGIPSAAALILKEAGLQKGSGTSGTTWVGDITPDAIVKVAKLKIDSSYATDIKSAAKEIIGTCLALGIKINGKNPKEITPEVNAGKWDDKFK
jgi:large subunit ribosomal protein L11